MKIKIIHYFIGIIAFLGLACMSSDTHNNEIVKIKLEKNKSDALFLGNQLISKAHIYGTKDDIIHFLINDKYIQHQHERGIIYHFLTKQSSQKAGREILENSDVAFDDSNAVLVSIPDSNDFREIAKLLFKPGDVPSVFKLGSVNNMNIYMSHPLNDDKLFEKRKDFVSVALERKRTDFVQIQGISISQAYLYGTKDNIIRFLINDKYVKHELDEGVNYKFISDAEVQEKKVFFKELDSISVKERKILITIQDEEEYKNAYNYYTKDEQYRSSFDLNGIEDMFIRVQSAQ